MSYILEAIIIPRDESIANTGIADADIKFDVMPLNGETSILARPGRPHFDEMVATIAEKMSKQLGKALHVRWDDRVGVRESRLYQDGALTHHFSPDDEAYVMLDVNGMPIRDGQKYRESELNALGDDVELEVYQNALELGCEHSGFCDWQSLHQFIRRQG